MSAEVQESSKKGKGSKQKKMTVRVDFTPMVVKVISSGSNLPTPSFWAFLIT